MDLSGRWRLSASDDDLRRRYHDEHFDDSAWATAEVPGHWQRHPAFATDDGPFLYRRAFAAAAPAPGRRSWLTFDGIFYQSDVWLDGVYLGDTEGYFFRHQFEVSELLRARSEHVLAVEVTCTTPRDKKHKRAITGIFQHSETLDPAANPGGIWRDVRIEETGPVRIRHRRVTCTSADESTATVAVRVVLDSDTDRSVTVRCAVDSSERYDAHRLAAGENQLEWTVTVANPSLWWPHSLGSQPLVDVTIDVHDSDGSLSDRASERIGLRSVEMHDYTLSVNGERLFVKGSAIDPVTYWLAEATEADYRRDLELARAANLDLLRVRAHVARPELYAVADEVGMLLWQDFPLKWGYHRTIRKQAVRQAREAIDLLAHHPSLVVWCAHDEPIPLIRKSERAAADGGGRAPTDSHPPTWKVVLEHQVPSYNRSVIDRSVAILLRREDRSRPVVAHSGMLPAPPRMDGSDLHLSLGWRVGDERQLGALGAAMPRLVRFVGEFGSQAVPVDADFIDTTGWPDLDWASIERHHSLDLERLARHVPPDAFASFEEWAQATRDYQATVIRFHVETLRRLKYHPTGGFTYSNLADAMPAVTTSVLSYDRVPKEGYQALADACRPVLAVAERLGGHVHAGEPLSVAVHVVSDLRTAIEYAETLATATWEGGRHEQRWTGRIPADSCTFVGTVDLPAPTVDGPLTLTLEVRHGGESVVNRYVTTVVTAVHEH